MMIEFGISDKLKCVNSFNEQKQPLAIDKIAHKMCLIIPLTAEYMYNSNDGVLLFENFVDVLCCYCKQN